MKKVLFGIQASIGLGTVGLTALLWDYLYYPWTEERAANKAKVHLKTTYREDFDIEKPDMVICGNNTVISRSMYL